MDAIEREPLQADSLEGDQTPTTQDDGPAADVVDVETASDAVAEKAATDESLKPREDGGDEAEGADAASDPVIDDVNGPDAVGADSSTLDVDAELEADRTASGPVVDETEATGPDSLPSDEDTEPEEDNVAGEPVDAEETPESAPRFIEGADWFFVHTYSGYENKVKNYLDQRIETMGMHDKIFQVIVPTEEEVEIRDGQKRSTRKRVFPGYILVQLTLDEESWYVVRNTPGVTGFVGTGTRPVSLSEEEVDTILDRMEEEQPRIKVSFRIGETVRITEGPFADFMAVVDNLYPERGKVRVLVSFFGRETPVEMDFLQVEQI